MNDVTDYVEAVTVEQPEWAEFLQEMLDTRRKQLASCERMLELLQPEWDRFEKRDGTHDTYVARDYADHTSAARTHRKEIAALEGALATRTQANEAMREAREALTAMMDAWFDYHDTYSLTEPVTGRAGNAFDMALAARDRILAALSGDSAKHGDTK